MVRSLVFFLLGALFYSQVNSHPAIPVAQPKGTSSTINALLAQEYLPANREFILQDDKLTNGINVTIKYPPIDVFLEKKSFEDRARDVLTQTLPSTLQQFGIPADEIQAKVDEGIPLLIGAIKELINDEHLGPRSLERREIGEDLIEWVNQYGCGLVASSGVGLYIIAALDFIAGNSGGKLSSESLDGELKNFLKSHMMLRCCRYFHHTGARFLRISRSRQLGA